MKRIITAAAALLCAASLYAAAPLWLRDVQISPKGDKVAFCYMGDIYTVPVKGGEATRLTTGSSFESTPIWSPDGSRIAFASDRFGNFDIFIVDADGGPARRLTYDSAKEVPTAFTPDGGKVIFGACIQDPVTSIQFPSSTQTEVYAVPADGGKTVQILGTVAQKICWSPDGSFFLYQDRKGIEDEWRKHHISSDTRDIWRYDVATGRHTNLTDRPGEDRDPVIAADGKTVYMISEPAGSPDGHPQPQGWQTSLNVYSFQIDKPSELRQVSSFKTHPVRFLSCGGNTLCYTWNGEIYTQVPGAEPVKLDIRLSRDDENIPEMMTASRGARASAVSPDGKQIAFSVRGEIFVTAVDYSTTKQITHTAAAESGAVFGSDNRTLVYASDRDGRMQLYKAVITRKEDPNFPNATTIEEEHILPSAFDRAYPCFSPDGKELAFIEDRCRLMVANVKTGAVRQVTDGSNWFSRGYGFDYDWSPDGRWFAISYTPNGHDPYYDIGIVSSDGGPVTNITGSGYSCGSPRFALDGNAITFVSERYGMRAHASWGSQDDVFICFLNQDAYDKYRLSKEDYELLKESEKGSKGKEAKSDDKEKKDDKAAPKVKAIKVELEGIQDRIARLTPHSSNLGDAILSKDGASLYYLASFEGPMDLWKLDVRSRETKLVSKGAGNGWFTTEGTGKTIFLLGGSMKKLDGNSFKPISFNAEYLLDHQAEREYMFNYVCREEQQRFYDVNMHGVDLAAYCEAYRRFLPHINNNYDFAAMLSELLGELNVSHTGARYYPRLPGQATARLGLLYDLKYEGQGLKVAEIIKDGPFDHAGLKLKAGDVITAIDGEEITDENGLSQLLAGKSGRKTLVSVKGKGDMVVIPITTAAQNSLMYTRWVRSRAAEVEKLSGGRLGYVHIKSMNDASYRDIYSDILGKYNKCEGIVIDTRYNGGGRLHEDIEILFEGKKYLTQVVRGKESCIMPSRRWTKPSIMIQGEANYSNAHGTPWVYKFKEIGKLVGSPVPGTMTSVNWVDLQDNSMLFGIPVVGYRTAGGYYLEDDQLYPDVPVLNTPEQVVSGDDAQLKAAVAELLKEIDGK